MESNKLVMITDGIILNYTNEACNNIVTDTRKYAIMMPLYL